MPRKYYHFCQWARLLDSFQSLNTVYGWHSQIQNNDINILFPEDFQGLFTTGHSGHIKASFIQPALQSLKKVYFIVHQQDSELICLDLVHILFSYLNRKFLFSCGGGPYLGNMFTGVKYVGMKPDRPCIFRTLLFY